MNMTYDYRNRRIALVWVLIAVGSALLMTGIYAAYTRAASESRSLASADIDTAMSDALSAIERMKDAAPTATDAPTPTPLPTPTIAPTVAVVPTVPAHYTPAQSSECIVIYDAAGAVLTGVVDLVRYDLYKVDEYLCQLWPKSKR